MTDQTLNYDAVLSLSPSESSRLSTTINPANGGPYKGSSSGQKISLDIPATAFLNPHSSYLQFNYTPSVQIVTPLAAGNNGYSVIDGGATSLFSRVALYAGQGGSEISSCTDFDFVAQSLIKRKGKVFVEQVATNAMGYHPLMTEFIQNNSSADAYYELASNGKVPAYHFDTNAIKAAGVYEGSVQKFAIPLSLFSGFFDVNRKIPLMMMGTATVLRLELTLNSPERALYVARQSGLLYNDAKFDFSLSGVELILNVSNVGEKAVMDVRNSINNSGVHMKYTNVTSSSDTWLGNINTFTNKHAKSLLSLNQLVVQMRNQSLINNIFHPSVTNCKRFALKNIQTSIGPVSYPQHPLQLDGATFNGNAYLENYLANDNKDKSVYGGHDSFYVSSYHDPERSGFEIGINFSSEHDKDSALFSGKDLRSGSNSINTRFERIPDATDINLTMIYFATHPLAILKSGIVPPNLG